MRPGLRHVIPMLLGALVFQLVCSTHRAARASENITRDQVIDYLDALTVRDVADLVKQLEDRWGVEAASAAVAVGPGGPAPVEEVREEQTEFDVLMRSFGPKKIEVIKAVRMIIPGLGLKEAKTLVESAPVVIKAQVPRDEAEAIKKQLQEAGADVELR